MSKTEPVRYHFTDETPFTVMTEEGEVALGKGWLAITEDHYAAFRMRPAITMTTYNRLLADLKMLRQRPDISPERYEELLARPPISERELKRLKSAKRELEEVREAEQTAYLEKDFYDENDPLRPADFTRRRS